MKNIKEIAKKAKVSTGTVDRVIHNRSGVSEKTRKRIQKIIDDSNFKINPVASSLASKKNVTIASLIPNSKRESDFWTLPQEGIISALSEIKNFGFQLTEFQFDQFQPETYKKAFYKLIESNPDAILIAPIFTKETKELVPLLDSKSIPYIFINVEINGLNNLTFIGQHSKKGGYLAAKMLYLLLPAATEIVVVELIKNSSNYAAIEDRISGFRTYFKEKESNIKNNSLQIYSIDEIEKQLSDYLVNNPNIKGIFVPSSKVSLIASVIENLSKKDIKIVGFDTTPENIKYLKNETIDFLISQQPYKQGYNGVKVLFNYLQHQKKPKNSYYSPIEIVTKENVDFIDTI